MHSIILKYIWWFFIFYQTVHFYFSSIFRYRVYYWKTKSPSPTLYSILAPNHSTLKKCELSLKYSVSAIKRLKCCLQLRTISFIPKLKRRELNLLQKRAYSALKYMQTAQRAFSLHGCCSHLLSSERCFASVCRWAQQRHTLEKANIQCFNGLGMTIEGQDAWVRFLAVSQMRCCSFSRYPLPDAG